MKAILSTLVLAFGSVAIFEAAIAQEQIHAYYFNQSGICTFLLDLQPLRGSYDGLRGDVRTVALAKALIDEFRAHGQDRCMGAMSVRAIAVYIPGVDNYGRPAFGSRTNLLRLQGPIEGLADATASQMKSLDGLKSKFEVEVY